MSGSKTLVSGLLVVTVVVGLVYMIDPTFFGIIGSPVEGFVDNSPQSSSTGKTPSPKMSGKTTTGKTAPPPPQTQSSQPTLQTQGSQSATPSQGQPSQQRQKELNDALDVAIKAASADGATCPMPTNQAVACYNTVVELNKAVDTARKAAVLSQFQDINHKEGFEIMASVSSTADFGTAEAPAGCYPRDQLTPSELLPKDNNSVWAEQNPMGPGSLKGKNFLSAGALLGVNTVGQSLRNANLQLRSEPPNPQMPVSIFNQSTIQPDVNRRPLEIN